MKTAASSTSDSSEDEHEPAAVPTATTIPMHPSQTTATKCVLWHRAKGSRWCRVTFLSFINELCVSYNETDFA